MKNPLIAFFAIFALSAVSAQKPQLENCASSEIMEDLLKKDPAFLQKHQKLEKEAEQYFAATSDQLARRTAFTLPVVVHIIHDNGDENLSDATIEQGMEYLNDAFSNQSYYDQGTGVDTEIAFCLAKRTPGKESSTGILRTEDPLTEFNYSTQDQALKDLARWDPTEYINIWVVKEICSFNGCGVAGYAYLPTAHGQPYDGIVVEYEYFGESEENTAVLVHEMGHYLGLYHTFEDGCNNLDCMTQGDRVCDTPPDQTTARPPCDHPTNSCDTDTQSGLGTDMLDMKNNYMDYSNLECYNAFTKGQQDRMYFFIENTRQSLLDSKGCEDPCLLPVTSIFNASSTSIETGESVSFINSSTNAVNYIWKVNGIPVSSNTNLTHLFNGVGTFTVTLIASNNLPDCFSDSTSIQISVDCNLETFFNASPLTAEVGETISFKNLSINATDYNWEVNSTSQSTSTDFDFTQSIPGIFTVCLEASNPFCDGKRCLTVEFVEDDDGSGDDDCDKAELKIYGDPSNAERPYALTVALDGNLMIGGAYGTESFLSKIKPDGTPIWIKSFDFSGENDERMNKLFISDDGFLVGAGTGRRSGDGRTADGFIFKFDLNTEQLVWSSRTQSSNPGVFFNDIDEMPGSGNFLCSGQTVGINCDANFVEFDKNTGQRVNSFTKNFDIGSCETFTDLKFLNGNILVTGRYNYAGGGTDKMRNTLSLFDMTGNEIWTKNYLVDRNRTARLYGNDITLENDKIYFTTYGNLNGTALGDGDAFLMICDEDGRAEQAMQYDLPGRQIRPMRMYSTATNFYIEMKDHTAEAMILMKTDKLGNIIYAFQVNEWEQYIQRANSTLIAGDKMFIIKGIQNPTRDFMLLKIPLDGEPDFTDCIDVEFLDFNETRIMNPYQESSSLIARDYNFNTTYTLRTPTDRSFEVQELCLPDCSEDCEDGIDNDGDGLIDCDDPDCPCDDPICIDSGLPDAIISVEKAFCKNDSLELEILLCNIGEDALPAQLPIQFYPRDPTFESSNPLFELFTEVPVPINECIKLTVRIPADFYSDLFVLANADNLPPPPYDLSNDFPITSISECNYENNLAMVSLDFIEEAWIELGDDVVICPNQAHTIAAVSNKTQYRWQDGSVDSTFTIFEEGTYWCCVTDDCGGSACDTIEVTYDEALQIDLGDDFEICKGDSVQVNVNSALGQRILWYPLSKIDCDTCMSNVVSPVVKTTYIVVGQTDDGCVAVDSMTIDVLPKYEVFDTIEFCGGDTVFIPGLPPFTQPGPIQAQFQTEKGCDSIFNYFLLEKFDTAFDFRTKNICPGESADIFGVQVSTPGVYTNIIGSGTCVKMETVELILNPTDESFDTISTCQGLPVSIFGTQTDEANTYIETFARAQLCDSIHSLTLIVKDTFNLKDQLTICANDSAVIFGSTIDIPGIYSKRYTASNGCDSISEIELIVLDTLESMDSLIICEYDSTMIFGAFETEPGVYSRSFTSLNGCDSTHSVVLEKTPLFNLIAESSPACFDDESGSGSVSINSGNPPFNFRWSNNSTDSVAQNLGVGTYFLTVTDRFGCEKIDSLKIENESFEVDQDWVQPLCFGESSGSIELISTNPDLEFSLNGGDFTSNSVFDNLQAGDYQLAIRNANGCLLETAVEITDPDPFFVELPGDTLIDLGDSIQILPSYNQNPQSYSWNPIEFLDCSDCSRIFARPLQTTVFNLVVANEKGCLAADSIRIRVQATRNIYAPSAFSPNDDGINDKFTIYGDATMTYIRELKIFDRWGNFVYDGIDLTPNDGNQGWDGTFRAKKMDPNVFAFYAVVEFIDGYQEIVKGDISLIK